MLLEVLCVCVCECFEKCFCLFQDIEAAEKSLQTRMYPALPPEVAALEVRILRNKCPTRQPVLSEVHFKWLCVLPSFLRSRKYTKCS